jgi:hypothetical protein
MRLIPFVIVAVIALEGCSRLDTQYGQTKGTAATRSLNGFSGLRQTFASQGANLKDIGRLNHRTMESDCIVWIPKSAGGIASKTSNWLDRWLSQGGRTLVYINPDSGSETNYYRELMPIAPPEQRLEYRRLFARSLIERMEWQAAREKLASNGWIQIQPLPTDQSLSRDHGLRGEWSDAIVDQDQITVEYSISAYDPEDPVASPTTTTFATVPTGPSVPAFGFTNSEVDVQSGDFEYQSLLSTNSGDVIAKVTSAKWNDSQVLVVSGGSLVTNFALAHPSGLNLADHIVNEAKRTSAKGNLLTSFATTDRSEIMVRDSVGEIQAPSGMEFLTTWPLSLVTIHGLIAGLIACLVMLPIFGRPRRLIGRSLANFGGHLDAVAALFSRRDSQAFAENRLREFHRVVNQDESRGLRSQTDPTRNKQTTTATPSTPKSQPTRPSARQELP